MIGIERNQLFSGAPPRPRSRASRSSSPCLGFNLLGDGVRDALDPTAQPMTDPSTAPARRRRLIEETGGPAPHAGASPAWRASAARGRRACATSFYTRDGVVRAVDGIDFHVDRGEVLGLVGESGCGKSVTSLSIMRLVAKPGPIEAGEVLFDGRDLLGPRRRRDAEDPRRADRDDLPAADLVAEPGLGRRPPDRRGPRDPPRHEAQGGAAAAPLELLQMVGIPDPERRLKAYPHELSGGMAQRVMIAMALACEPELLIADEPTTALDVTIQAQILDLMRHLREETGTAIILITHDLGVVAEMCDRVAVMYAGEIVEQTDVRTLFREPEAPLHAGLIGSIPVLGVIRDELAVIPGNVPNLIDLPPGCRFAPALPARVRGRRWPAARDDHPELRELGAGHDVRCFLLPRRRTARRPGPDRTRP